MKFVSFYGEPNLTAWFWRLLIGPAKVVDGIIFTLSLGCVDTGMEFYAVCQRALAQIGHKGK